MSNNDPFAPSDDKNYLEELVGDGKKFNSVEALAKGKAESDAYIETLKSQLVAEQAKAANGMNVDKLMEEIRKLNAGNVPNDQRQPLENDRQAPSSLNVEELVLQTLRKDEQTRTIAQNRQTVIDKVNEVWGADASKELQKTARTLGVSVDYLNSVAQQSPSVFFQLTGLNNPRGVPSGTAVPTSTVRFGESSGTKRDLNFYNDMRRTNPALFRETKTKIQMERDALAQGEDFFN